MKSIIAFGIICSLVGLASSLDCRKFSFAPACRGIMLKRASTDFSAEPTQENQYAETISSLLEEAEQLGFECINLDWLRKKLTTSGESVAKRSFSRFNAFA